MKTNGPLLWGLAVAATLGSSLSLEAAQQPRRTTQRVAASSYAGPTKVRARTQSLARQVEEPNVLPDEELTDAPEAPMPGVRPRGTMPARPRAGGQSGIPSEPMHQHDGGEMSPGPAPDGLVDDGVVNGYGGMPGGSCSDGGCGCDESCGGYCGDCCECVCGPPGKYWIRWDYLFWQTRGMSTPPLLTTSPNGTTTNVGVLGQPTTRVLFGGEELNDDGASGGKFTFGFWLDECMQCGIEFDYLALGDQEDDYFISSAGNPLLARPFTDISTGVLVPSSQLVAQPGLIDGSFSADVDTDFQSGGVLYRSNLLCENFCQPSILQTLLGHCCPGVAPACARIDFIAGYRHYRLNDRLAIREDLISRDPGGFVQVGTRFLIDDEFETENEFNGAEIGFIEDINRGPWQLSLTAKVALGNNQQTVRINGATTITPPNQAGATSPGGLLAQPTNIGTYERNDFAAIPFLSMNLGYQWTCRLRTHVGYSFMYWNDVARAGDQIDTVVNTSQLPPGNLAGAPRPAFNFEDTHFWAHGINAGLEYRF